MFLEQKATDVTTEDVLKGIEQLGNLDFSKIKMSSLIEKLVEWAATTGFKLIVGALIISIGFKIINKLVGRFMNVLEKREVDITISKFLKSLITVSIRILGYTIIWYCCISSVSWGCNRFSSSREFI